MDLVQCFESWGEITLPLFSYKIASTKSLLDDDFRKEQFEFIKLGLEQMVKVLDDAEECFRGSVQDYTEEKTRITASLVTELEATCQLLPNDTGYKKDLTFAKENHRVVVAGMSEFELAEMKDIYDRIEVLKRMFQAQLIEVQTIV